MLTRGRLVSRQPWAIKRTTRTELHHENIYNVKYIHWNTDITPTALRRCNIRNAKYIHRYIGIKNMALHRYHVYHGKYIHCNIGIKPTASVINKQFIGLY